MKEFQRLLPLVAGGLILVLIFAAAATRLGLAARVIVGLALVAVLVYVVLFSGRFDNRQT